MKEAILLVGHGSRDAEGNEELLRFAELVREQAPYETIHACFLEFASPDIPAGIATCVQQGAERIVLVPIILFGAGHSKLHIPAEIKRARQQYPHVEFAYGSPVGIHTKIIHILKARLAEAGLAEAQLPHHPHRSADTAVLLLGRGSSDPDANSNVYKMTRLLWEQVAVKWVETCFIGVTEPSFPEGLDRCLRLGAKRIVIVPYFLFTGILMKRIERMTAQFAELHPDVDVRLSSYFGFHPDLVDVLLERMQEAVSGTIYMNCDLCQYRLFVPHEHHHHHDHDHDHAHEHHSHDHDHEAHDHKHPHHSDSSK